jgi:hypothetical protein
MRFLKLPLSIILPVTVAACANSPEISVSAKAVSYTDLRESIAAGSNSNSVSVRGRIHPVRSRAIYLTDVDYVIPGDARVPSPRMCIQVLASMGQFRALKKVAGKPIIATGTIHIFSPSENEAAVYVKVKERDAHPDCQDEVGRFIVLYLNEWQT